MESLCDADCYRPGFTLEELTEGLPVYTNVYRDYAQTHNIHGGYMVYTLTVTSCNQPDDSAGDYYYASVDSYKLVPSYDVKFNELNVMGGTSYSGKTLFDVLCQASTHSIVDRVKCLEELEYTMDRSFACTEILDLLQANKDESEEKHKELLDSLKKAIRSQFPTKSTDTLEQGLNHLFFCEGLQAEYIISNLYYSKFWYSLNLGFKNKKPYAHLRCGRNYALNKKSTKKEGQNFLKQAWLVKKDSWKEFTKRMTKDKILMEDGDSYKRFPIHHEKYILTWEQHVKSCRLSNPKCNFQRYSELDMAYSILLSPEEMSTEITDEQFLMCLKYVIERNDPTNTSLIFVDDIKQYYVDPSTQKLFSDVLRKTFE